MSPGPSPTAKTPSTKFIAGSSMFALIGYGALLIFGLGAYTVLADADVITDPRAGLVIGPVMLLGSIVPLWLGMLIVAKKRDAHTRWFAAIIVALLSWLSYILLGMLLWLIFSPELAVTALFFGWESAASWPSLIILVTATLTSIVYQAVISAQVRKTHGDIGETSA